MLKIKYDLSFRGIYSHQEVVLIDSLQPQLMVALILMQKLDNQSVQLQSDCISSYLKTYPSICNHEIAFKNISVEKVGLNQEDVSLLQSYGVLVMNEQALMEWFKHKLHGVLTCSEFQGRVMSESVVKHALAGLMDFNKSLPSEITRVALDLIDEVTSSQSLESA